MPRRPLLFTAILLALLMMHGGCTTEPEVVELDSGLRYERLREGSGEPAGPGTVAQVHYRARVAGREEAFDDSYERGVPYQFPVDGRNVLPGWRAAVQLMRVGERGRITMPPELAFGAAGYGDVVPPHATLVFEAELVGVRPADPNRPPPLADSLLRAVAPGVHVYDWTVGTGRSLHDGLRATVHYTGWVAGGDKFDSSRDNGEPYTFWVDEAPLPSWSEALAGMQVGGLRRIVVAPEQAYGASGAGPIPPNATLVFDVELLDLQDL